MNPEIVCGQPILMPGPDADPAVVQCYADAAQWLRENCPGCSGSVGCQANLRALYMLWIQECDEIHSAAPDEAILDGIRSLRRLYEARRA